MLKQSLPTMGRIPQKITDVFYSPIGPSTLHPYVIGFATNRCPASAGITRARTPLALCSLIGSTVSAKYLPRAVMVTMCYILFLHVWENTVMCTGDLGDCEQHVPHSCTVQEIQQAVTPQPQGAYMKGCCGRKWLSSEQNTITYLATENNGRGFSIAVQYTRTQFWQKNLPGHFYRIIFV